MRSSCTEPRPAHKLRAAAVGFGWRWQGKEERVAAAFCVEETVTNAACRFQSKSHLIYSETVRERGERSRSFHLTFFFLLLLPFLPHWHLAKFPVVDLKQCSISKHLGMSLPLSSRNSARLWTGAKNRDTERHGSPGILAFTRAFSDCKLIPLEVQRGLKWHWERGGVGGVGEWSDEVSVWEEGGLCLSASVGCLSTSGVLPRSFVGILQL